MKLRLVVASLLVLSAACAGSARAPEGLPTSEGADAAFRSLASEIIRDHLARNPALATDLGVHDFDDRLFDFSKAAALDKAKALRGFRERLDTIDPATLSLDARLDREILIHRVDAGLLEVEVIRSWAKDPDLYSSGITNAAYGMIKRRFAPPEVRLRHLIALERAMPAALMEARKNLENPPKIYTEIAIEQIDGSQDLFRTAVPAAFAGVRDPTLQAQLEVTNAAVIEALGEYKRWLEDELLPRSNGEFAYGEETFRKRLWNDEMIDLPIDELLAIAEADLAKNQKAFAEAAAKLDPKKSPRQVLDMLEAEHPPASELLQRTQATLDALKQFMRHREIVSLPDAASAEVKQTPPFMAATTSASMETPGPFEAKATEAFYNMTLPDPKWPPSEQEEFMKQWYEAMISNVSVHEVWPGHYLQFLYAKQFPSEVRKVFDASSNSEGWAHYAEQMVIDEGFHKDDPRYRLAQMQDAILRDARFIVGIKLHTKGMTIEEAQKFFIEEGYQPGPVARSETKRGTSDATYGYYTMGKLMILKLREDWRAKMGESYSLQKFHDTFIALGPLPLPLVRQVMLGEVGELF